MCVDAADCATCRSTNAQRIAVCGDWTIDSTAAVGANSGSVAVTASYTVRSGCTCISPAHAALKAQNPLLRLIYCRLEKGKGKAGRAPPERRRGAHLPDIGH